MGGAFQRDSLTSRVVPSPGAPRPNPTAIFVRTAGEIEALRRAELFGALQSEREPPKDFPLCAPWIMPLLAPRIRERCEAFPAKAEALVKARGLDAKKFNSLLKRAEWDPWLRWRVMRAVAKVKRARKAKAP